MEEIDRLFFYEFLQVYKKTLNRKEEEAKMELIRMQQLAVVIHADNPNELMEKIDSILDGEDIDNDIGDLDKLKRFKEKNTYRK